MNKRGQKGQGNLVLIGVIAIAAYLIIWGVPDFSGDDDTGVETPTGSTEGCNVEDVSFSPSMVQMGKAGTSVADNYYILTDKLGSKSGATTLPTNKDVEVMFAENSTTYYTVVEEFNTDCSDPYYMSVDLPKADTTLTGFKAENEDGSINAVSNAQPLGADDIIEFEVCFKASSNEYFGNPTTDCENIGVVEFDKTYIRSVEGSLGAADVPGFFTETNSTNDGRDAFVIPKVGDGEKECFSIQIESTTSNIGSGNVQPILHVYDCDTDKDEDDLSLIYGVEDEDDNSISLAAQTLTVYLS